MRERDRALSQARSCDYWMARYVFRHRAAMYQRWLLRTAA